MQISTLRNRVSRELLTFAWNEWAQMGVLAEVRRRSPWAADPEAHLLFTLQIGRDDPRLFDEVLDWFSINGALISAQRLRNMAGSEEDARLVEAAAAWISRQGGRFRSFAAKPRPASPSAQPLFYDAREPSREDETFARFGFLRAPVARSGKSRRPDLRLPINFAFRVRNVFGVGSRAEVMRFLLTTSRNAARGQQPRFSTPSIAADAGFAKRNVHEALVALAEAGTIEMSAAGREHYYSIDADAWRKALGLEDAMPMFRDWPHALLGFRELHRWLARAELEDLSPYMRASEARVFAGQIEASFSHAGLSVTQRGLPAGGDDYWPVFVDFVDRALRSLQSARP
jgi:hypothetical protein